MKETHVHVLEDGTVLEHTHGEQEHVHTHEQAFRGEPQERVQARQRQGRRRARPHCAPGGAGDDLIPFEDGFMEY